VTVPLFVIRRFGHSNRSLSRQAGDALELPRSIATQVQCQSLAVARISDLVLGVLPFDRLVAQDADVTRPVASEQPGIHGQRKPPVVEALACSQVQFVIG
jgi:hypothetical protein